MGAGSAAAAFRSGGPAPSDRCNYPPGLTSSPRGWRAAGIAADSAPPAHLGTPAVGLLTIQDND
jgi:hypothetical protein